MDQFLNITKRFIYFLKRVYIYSDEFNQGKVAAKKKKKYLIYLAKHMAHACLGFLRVKIRKKTADPSAGLRSAKRRSWEHLPSAM